MASKKTSANSSHSAKTSHAKSTSSKGEKKYRTKAGNPTATPPSHRWSSKVKTDSTKPAPGIFTKSAKAIAENLEKKSVSPEGPGQGMRMLSFYENRAGKNLSAERKRTLEHAKDLLREKEAEVADKSSGKKSSASKSRSKKNSSTKKSTKSSHSSAKKSTSKKKKAS